MQIGDKVKVLDNFRTTLGGERFIGQEGEVEFVCASGTVIVSFNNGEECPFNPDKLAHVECAKEK